MSPSIWFFIGPAAVQASSGQTESHTLEAKSSKAGRRLIATKSQGKARLGAMRRVEHVVHISVQLDLCFVSGASRFPTPDPAAPLAPG
jgi:hypothetical protein